MNNDNEGPRVLQKNVSFFFVIDPPALLVDSVILVCTLRAHFETVEVIAYCPEGKRDLVPQHITEFFSHMNVDLRFMPSADPELHFKPHYKQGNKIIAACQPRSSMHSVFLDTDIAIAKPFDVNLIAQPGCVGVVPEGRFTWGKNPLAWEAVYAKFGIAVPEERVTLSRSRLTAIPYFNAGVISFPTDSRFAELWMDTARAVDADASIAGRRPWLDQIALPVAIARAGLAIDVLDIIFNLSLSRKLEDPEKDVRETEGMDRADGHILHFHQPKFISGTRYVSDVDAALRRFTSYRGLDDLTAASRTRESEVQRVWSQFETLKKKERTAEEEIIFRQVRAEKHAMKAALVEASRFLESQPASILPQ